MCWLGCGDQVVGIDNLQTKKRERERDANTRESEKNITVDRAEESFMPEPVPALATLNEMLMISQNNKVIQLPSKFHIRDINLKDRELQQPCKICGVKEDWMS
jgi:hypothetical protein